MHLMHWIKVRQSPLDLRMLYLRVAAPPVCRRMGHRLSPMEATPLYLVSRCHQRTAQRVNAWRRRCAGHECSMGIL